jgi:glycosyltransferase involved in cell wall biosynthesis
MVYEIDDHLLNVPADNELASAWYNRLDVRQEILLNIRSADMLTVSTPALATEFARYTDRPIFVLPNRIPAYLLDFPHPTHPRSDEKIVFGWAGSMTHGGDFDSIGRMIARFGKRNADRVRLHMMGHNYLPASFGDVRFTPWTSGVRNYYHTLNFDVGLAPLVPNTFNMCKSAIKVLEYAAIGIPSIASDVGPYPSFVENGINGLLIRTDHEWERSMSRLLNEPDTRLHMGENARRDARRHTIEEHARAWLDAYEWGARNAV